MTFSQALKLCDETEINAMITGQTQLLMSSAISQEISAVAKSVGFLGNKNVEGYDVFYGTMDNKPVVGKVISSWTADWMIGRELIITQLLSGKKHFPTLLKYSTFKALDDQYAVFMVFPRYEPAPVPHT